MKKAPGCGTETTVESMPSTELRHHAGRMSKRRLGPATLSIWPIFAACATTPPPSAGDLDAYIPWVVEREREEHGIAGVQVAVASSDGLVWSTAVGWADAERKVPLKEDTPFRLGSVTKLFTATAIVMLAERGRVDLDRPVVDDIPEFTVRSRGPSSAPITPRHLLTHHSGLPSDLLAGMITPEPDRFDVVLRWLPKVHAATPPDTVFAYSNVGYDLLGCLIERASGQSYEDFVRENLFAPLKMTHASFVVADEPNRGHQGGVPQVAHPLRSLPAGGIVATATDVARLLSFYLAAPADSVFRRMWERANHGVPLDLSSEVGLGWRRNPPGFAIDGVAPILGHDGATLFFHAVAVIAPGEDRGVVVLANSAEAGASTNRIAHRALRSALEAKNGKSYPAPSDRRELGPALDRPEVDLVPYEGTYATAGAMIRLRPDGDDHVVELTSGDETERFTLVPHAGGRFSAKAYFLGFIPVSVGGLVVSFEEVGGHRVIAVHGKDGSKNLLATRVEVRSPSAIWKERVGRYRVSNAAPGEHHFFDSARLEIDEQRLLLYAIVDGGAGTFLLDPIADDQAVLAGYGRALSETLYATETGLRLAGVELVRIPD